MPSEDPEAQARSGEAAPERRLPEDPISGPGQAGPGAAPDPLALLGRAGALLQDAADAPRALRAVLDLLVPALADYGLAYLRGEDGAMRVVASAHADAALAPLLSALASLDPADGAHPVGRAIDGRTPLQVDVTPGLEASARSPEHARVLHALSPRSALIVPVMTEARVLGALALGTVETGRPPLRAGDVDLVVEVAARAALVLENARLRREADAELDGRQRAAQALRHERELLQRLIDTIPVMISVYRPDARVLRVNRAFERTLGWSSEEAKDASLLEQCYPDPAYRAEVRRYMQSLESGWRDFRMTTKDGRLLETSWANIRLSDDTQVGIGIDIGERKAAERERLRLYEAERRARAAAERLQALAAALSEAVTEAAVGDVVMHYGATAAGATAGVLAVRVDDELEVLACAGEPTEAPVRPGHRWPLTAPLPIAHAARSGRPVMVRSAAEWHGLYGREDLEPAWTGAMAAWPVDCKAGPAAVLAWTYDGERAFTMEERDQLRAVARLCADALERARLYDAERNARQEAETANRVKSRFLGVMSHELRTPLNAVLGYADLLLMELSGPLRPEQKSQLQRIRTSARVQLELIEEILTYARLEAGREELRLTVVDVPAVVRDACDLLRTQIESKGLELRLTQPNGPLGIVSDPAKLRQILLNLIGNAVKFTNAGSVDVRTEGDEHGLEVRVSDTGDGIEADKLELIFQPFMQIDQSTTRENGGTGLGLSIARRFARLLGGDIEVSSEPGTGSTFVLRLPLTVSSTAVRLAMAAPEDP